MRARLLLLLPLLAACGGTDRSQLEDPDGPTVTYPPCETCVAYEDACGLGRELGCEFGTDAMCWHDAADCVVDAGEKEAQCWRVCDRAPGQWRFDPAEQSAYRLCHSQCAETNLRCAATATSTDACGVFDCLLACES